MISKEWLEQEIKTLDGLEGPAAVRAAELERTYLSVYSDLLEARKELEALRGCKAELMWQLAHMTEKEGKP